MDRLTRLICRCVLNILDSDSAVASFVPYLKIYDKAGNLVAEGRAANAWLQQALRERI